MKAMDRSGANPGKYAREALIRFEEGLIGFSDCKDFVLLENEQIAPFRRLQSVDRPEVCFYVLDPSIVFANFYSVIPSREWESVELPAGTPRLAFVICIVGPTPRESTGNFQAPLIINHSKMIGKQVILTEPHLVSRQPLLAD